VTQGHRGREENGRKLFGVGAPVIDPKALQGKAVHGLDHKMDQGVLGHPLTKVRR
jgi:hypothetical protein